MILFTWPMQAQAQQQPIPEAIKTANALRNDQPQEAIRLLKGLLQEEADPDQIAMAFNLLGDIYTDIGQWNLAIKRYEQALSLEPLDNRRNRANIYEKIGRAYLLLDDRAGAQASFEACLSLVDTNGEIGLKCQEGLADLAVVRNELDISQSSYNTIQQARPDDPILQSRVAAKRAKVYLQQNQIDSAIQNYDYAVEQLPRGTILEPAAYEEVIAANLSLNRLSYSNENFDKETSPTVRPIAEDELLPLPLRLTDYMARFRGALENGNLEEASNNIEAALHQVDTTTAPQQAAEVLQEGANFFLERGELQRATQVYQLYLSASNKLLLTKQAELDLQTEVLKEQQGVDLALKDLKIAGQEKRILSEQVKLQRWLIAALLTLLLGALLSVILVLLNVRKRKKANQQLLLRSLQGNMNPHFIFNSLNSINNYIAKRDERSANRFLGRFAKLMRSVLDQSGQSFIPIQEEVAQLQLYLELEQQRFAGKFTYALSHPREVPIEGQALEIPPMLLQPFVENAIWHGLRYLPEGGLLEVDFHYQEDRLMVSIIDNGIGREKSLAIKTKNQQKHISTGLKNTRQRIDLVNQLYAQNIELKITDATSQEGHPGTKVVLVFPY